MNTAEGLQELRDEMAALRTEMIELRALQESTPSKNHKYTQKEKRWLEVCRCFRDGKGKVSTHEADIYLQIRWGNCKKLVVAGVVSALESDCKGKVSKRLFVDAGLIEQAVRTGYFQ